MVSQLGLLEGASRVRPVVDEFVEVSEHDVVVPLRLEVHFSARVHIQLLKECEHFPEAQRDAQPLQLVLEQLGVDLLGHEDVGRNDFQVLTLVVAAS